MNSLFDATREPTLARGSNIRSDAVGELERLNESLRMWLDRACELWWSNGADHGVGGFHERLYQDGRPTGEPRRSRLHPRQIYACAVAHELGWSGPAVIAIRHALQFYLTHYRRRDRLFLTLVGVNGSVLDGRALLYDQAFALLGFASAYGVLGDMYLREDAGALLRALQEHFPHSEGGFEEIPAGDLPLTSNSHMHLLEAALAWMGMDTDPRWHALAGDVVALATDRFVDGTTGLLLEFFDRGWRPQRAEQGQRAEPGHHFEWAWLLLRWYSHTGDSRSRELALRLIDLAESHGVDRERQVAINALSPSGAVLDTNARLWPQTERLKANLLAAGLTGQETYWTNALASAQSLTRYLDVPLAGLWRDTLDANGTFIDEPAPASSFYHLAGAMAQLGRSVQRTTVC